MSHCLVRAGTSGATQSVAACSRPSQGLSRCHTAAPGWFRCSDVASSRHTAYERPSLLLFWFSELVCRCATGNNPEALVKTSSAVSASGLFLRGTQQDACSQIERQPLTLESRHCGIIGRHAQWGVSGHGPAVWKEDNYQMKVGEMLWKLTEDNWSYRVKDQNCIMKRCCWISQNAQPESSIHIEKSRSSVWSDLYWHSSVYFLLFSCLHLTASFSERPTGSIFHGTTSITLCNAWECVEASS